jgi:hypothetical protein
MASKKKKPSENVIPIPKDLEDSIKNCMAAAFPDVTDLEKKVNIEVSKFYHAFDYQFNIRGLTSMMKKDPNEILSKFKEKISDNQLIKEVEISENKSYINIFTSSSRSRPCKTCENDTKLGRQNIEFSHDTQKSLQLLLEELSRTLPNMDSETRDRKRKDCTMAQKIHENFNFLLGGDCELTDIKKAVESVGNRDYPGLNSQKISPIFVPTMFLAKFPEVLDYEKGIQKLETLKDSIDVRKARDLKKDSKSRIFTEHEAELVEKLKKVDQLEHIVGEYAEKSAYFFLKDCIEDDEVLVINNFKIMAMNDLDDIAEEFEKDFLILNLTKRFIMSLEVKAYCNETSLKSAKSQLSGCKNLIEKWCADLSASKNGWFFYSVIYFQHKPKGFNFCDKCSKYIIFDDEFKKKFNDIINEIPSPPSGTETKARYEFKKVAKNLLFLASYEPVATPARTTEEVAKMVDKAGQYDNILYWNQIFCWTPNQLSLLKDESLRYVIFLSPPSCGKTFIKKAKAKLFAQKGQKVAFFIPTYCNLRTLLSFQLEQELKGYSENIKIVNVVAGNYFKIDKDHLHPLLESYKDHHIFLDEVAIWDDEDIEVIKSVVSHCQSEKVALWFTVSFVLDAEIQRKLLSVLNGFHVVKDELSIPLRNTNSIARHAYKIEGKNKLQILVNVQNRISAGHALGIWIRGCSLFHRRELCALKIRGCKR